MADLPSGTVTFLFTDVEGSTKLLHELGAEAYDEALITHRSALREAFQRHGGVEVDTQGDAFFYAFPTAPGAVAAAREGIEALSSGQIRVRVGLHTGTPHIGQEGYIGDDVHLGARIAGTAHGGQVVLSRETRALVEGDITDLGEHRLKDIPKAVPIFQLGNGSFPPLKTISNTNLPTPASSFVGRDDELREVLSRFEDGARLVTLTGPGGTGKTRLAIEAAATLVPAYKAGVFWVGLATLRDPALVTETIAQTLGAKDGLAAHIGEREMLLLLDNLEQVIEAAPELSELLLACQNLTLLVTSRELLRIQGEVEYAVPPLAEPEAISLFCERAQLDPNGDITELCRRLDALPLAVELAAARTSALTPVQILERLSQRLDLLKGGRDVDPRQQTLRAAIEWSYDLLSSEEQELFARLSVFAGCTLEAAEEVCDADLDTLQSLVEKSLLRFTDGRYWMLETIREYAAERLEQSGYEGDLSIAHAEWVVKFAEETGGRELLKDRPMPVERMVTEVDNVRAAVASSLARGDATLVLRMGIALWFFWSIQGYGREASRWLEDALEVADPRDENTLWARLAFAELLRFSGDVQQCREINEELLPELRRRGEKRLVAATLADLSDFAIEAGEYGHAHELLDESLELRLEIGGVGLGRTLTSLGELALREGELEEAVSLFKRAAEDAAAVDPNGANHAGSLEGLGEAVRRQGDVAEAGRIFAESLRICHENGYVVGMADCLDGLASIALDRGQHDRAARLAGAARTLRRRHGLRSWRVPALAGIPEEATDASAVLGIDEAVEDALASVD